MLFWKILPDGPTMDRKFRLVLRIAVLLTLLGGGALVLYAGRGEPARPDVIRPERNEPSQTPAGGTTGQGSPPESTGGPQEGAEPAEANTGLESVLLEFSQVIRDPEDEESQALLTGPRAVYNPEAEIYKVVEPLVIAHVADEQGGGELDVELGNVSFSAREATFNEAERWVELHENVVMEGEDLKITTDQLTYRAGDRTLSSDTQVQMYEYQVDSSGVRRLKLIVEGEGAKADLSARKVTILSNVKTRLFDVSRDFLAGGAAGDEEPAGDTQQLTITADGKGIYNDQAGKVSFFENVRAEFGSKSLLSDKLAIVLGEETQNRRLEVSDVLADGNVRLFYGDEMLRGDAMEWRNVTQTGVLKGEPAEARTRQFDLRGTKLTFYRLNNRFQAEGAGELAWKGTAGTQPDQAETSSAPWQSGPLQMSRSEPIRVTWQESMTYDVAGRVAVCRGEARVEQGANSLNSDTLEVTFEEDNQTIRNLTARGEVIVRDEFGDAVREVDCQELKWDARGKSVELTAPEGQNVTVRTDRQVVTAPRVIVDNRRQAIACPTHGRLSIEPARSDEQEQDAAEAVPVAVEWKDHMEFTQKERPVATFQGEVVARRHQQLIRGRELRVEFDERMNPLQIRSTGEALMELRPRNKKTEPADRPPTETAEGLLAIPRLKGEYWRLEAESVSIDPRVQSVQSQTPGTLTVLKSDKPSGAISWQDEMKVDSVRGQAEFQGDVEAQLQGAELSTDWLRLLFDQGGQLRHTAARGNVFFAAGGESGWELKSESAEAIFGTGNVLRQFIARDDVEIIDPDQRLRARRAQFFLASVEGREEPVITRAVAEGDVWVEYRKKEQLEAGGDRLSWDRETDTFVLTGDPYAYVKRDNVKTQNWKITLDGGTGQMSLPEGDRPVVTVVGGRD